MIKTRKEAYAHIKENPELKEFIADKVGKNYTNATTQNLIDCIHFYIAEKESCKKCTCEETNAVYVDVETAINQIQATVCRLVENLFKKNILLRSEVEKLFEQ